MMLDLLTPTKLAILNSIRQINSKKAYPQNSCRQAFEFYNIKKYE